MRYAFPAEFEPLGQIYQWNEVNYMFSFNVNYWSD